MRPTPGQKEDYLNACRILEIPSNMTQRDIRQKYKALALMYHPDKNPSVDSEKMKAINAAFETIIEFKQNFEEINDSSVDYFTMDSNEDENLSNYELDSLFKETLERFRQVNQQLYRKSHYEPMKNLKPSIHDIFSYSLSCHFSRIDPLIAAILLSSNTIEAFYYENKNGWPALHYLVDLATRDKSASYLAVCMLEYAIDMNFDFLAVNKEGKTIAELMPFGITDVDYARKESNESLYDIIQRFQTDNSLAIEDSRNSQEKHFPSNIKTTHEIVEKVKAITQKQTEVYFAKVLTEFEQKLSVSSLQSRGLSGLNNLITNPNVLKNSPEQRFATYHSAVEAHLNRKRNFLISNSLFSLRSPQIESLYHSILQLNPTNLSSLKNFEKLVNELPSNSSDLKRISQPQSSSKT